MAKKKAVKATATVKAGTSRVEAARKRTAFIDAMCDPDLKGNGTQAAIKAGYAAKSAAVSAARLLRDAQISSAIAQRRKELLEVAQEKTGLTVAGVLQELHTMVHSDLRKAFNPQTGALLPPHQWPDDLAKSMASVKVVEMAGGMQISGEDGEVSHVPMYTKEVKLWDKNSAIDKAMKHLGLFEADNRQKPLIELPPGVKEARFVFDKVRTRGK